MSNIAAEVKLVSVRLGTIAGTQMKQWRLRGAMTSNIAAEVKSFVGRHANFVRSHLKRWRLCCGGD